MLRYYVELPWIPGGSALLLVDDSGAVTVELNPGEPAGDVNRKGM